MQGRVGEGPGELPALEGGVGGEGCCVEDWGRVGVSERVLGGGL